MKQKQPNVYARTWYVHPMEEEDGTKGLVVGNGFFQEHLKLVHKKGLVVCTGHYRQWLKGYNLTH